MRKAAHVTHFIYRSIPFFWLIPAAALGQTPDVARIFGDVGFSACRLDAFAPADAGLGTLGGRNPTRTPEPGERRHVRVVNSGTHPLEVVAGAASASTDKVLPATGPTPGTFASDPAVKWGDPGRGIVRLTLTAPGPCGAAGVVLKLVRLPETM